MQFIRTTAQDNSGAADNTLSAVFFCFFVRSVDRILMIWLRFCQHFNKDGKRKTAESIDFMRFLVVHDRGLEPRTP